MENEMRKETSIDKSTEQIESDHRSRLERHFVVIYHGNRYEMMDWTGCGNGKWGNGKWEKEERKKVNIQKKEWEKERKQREIIVIFFLITVLRQSFAF